MSKAYNLKVIKHALNEQGFRLNASCPVCDNEATHKDYDRNDGGCINNYFRTDCGHCGHHICNDEFCVTCEAIYHQSEQYALEQKHEINNRFSDLLTAINENSLNLSPVLITATKAYMHRYLNEIGCFSNPKNDFKKTIMSVLSVRFKHGLDLKIKTAA